ncbi:MAG: sortase [Thermomicrobiaceae bacterium]
MATTTGRLVRTLTYHGQPARRGMLPISGLMILFAVLMFGLALAIPASRAIQEAEMRERIAGVATTDDENEEEDSASESTAPISSGSSLPGIAGPPVESSSSENSSPPPQPIEEVSRNSDIASTLRSFGASGEQDSGENNSADEAPPRNPKPTHIRIPGVEIATSIKEVGYTVKEIEGQRVREWDVASYAAGHHKTSARPGENGNIVITGHNDWEGEVFRTLEYVEHGQEVIVTTEAGEHRYVIEEIHMRKEVGVSMEERLETGRFMAEMPEERLTLITCWPYGINDHRVIVVAMPVDS